MLRHPPLEFGPYNMINNNYNGNVSINRECPVRHPLPPPPPGTVEIDPQNNTCPQRLRNVEIGPHNHTRPQRPISVNRARMMASQYRLQVHINRMMLVSRYPVRGPVPRAFGRLSSSHQPSNRIPANPRNQHDADFHTMETDEYEHEPNPVNFASCNERFNGIGDVRPFINAILDFKYCSEMKDESALQSFSLLLTDQAAHWWKANKSFVTDWNTAIKLLRYTFRARTQQHRIYHRFFNSAQKEETTAEFVQRTKTLLNLIPVNTLTQETQLDMIFALLHRRIKDNVNRDDCDTLTDLVERARQVEASIAAGATAPPQEPSEAQEAAVEEPMLPEDPPVDINAAPKQKPTLEIPASPDALIEPDALATPGPSFPSLASTPIPGIDEPWQSPCDRCRKYGMLFKRLCRKLHKGESSPQSIALLEELHKLDAEKFHKLVCFRCQSDNIVNFKCQKCTHEIAGGSPSISVSIFEKDFKFVVDTGSSHSIASSELINHLAACGQEFTFKSLIMPIKGVPVRQVFRVANVVVMVAGVMVETVLVDLPTATKSVFGMDFIKEAGLKMNFDGEGTWTVRGGDGEQPVFYERLYRFPRLY